MPYRKKADLTFLGKYRRNRGLTLRDLKEGTGLSPKAIYLIEGGESISRTNAAKYLYLLGFDLNRLEGGETTQHGEFLDVRIIDEGTQIRIDSQQPESSRL